MEIEQKYNDFYTQTNGKFVEAEDSSNYAQCMDLVFKWLDALKIPRDTIRHLYAYQVWTMPFDSTRQYFDLIPNSPTNIPVIGDIPVFSQQVGFAGHISITAPGSTMQNLVSLDQNWGNPKSTRLVTHVNYFGVMGWLHPKTITDPLAKVISDIRLACDEQTTNVSKIAKIKYLLNV
jgi:hypothetical protein